jgi:hypothetical protein
LRFHARRRCVIGRPLDLVQVGHYPHLHGLVGCPNLLGLFFVGLGLGSLLLFGRLKFSRFGLIGLALLLGRLFGLSLFFGLPFRFGRLIGPLLLFGFLQNPCLFVLDCF